MPEKRLSKARETLPEGYRFGDAKYPYWQLYDINTDETKPHAMKEGSWTQP